MILTDYTTYDDVRSSLGLSSDELSDEILGQEVWVNHLAFDMEDINATLESSYLMVAGIAPESRTAAEIKVYRAARLFCTLSTANALLASLPMFGPKDITDGKAAISRFADAPYKTTIKKIEEQYRQSRERVVSALAELGSSTATLRSRTYFGTVGLGTDPVTG